MEIVDQPGSGLDWDIAVSMKSEITAEYCANSYFGKSGAAR